MPSVPTMAGLDDTRLVRGGSVNNWGITGGGSMSWFGTTGAVLACAETHHHLRECMHACMCARECACVCCVHVCLQTCMHK